MGLNATPSANRVHIAFFGMRNAGKSSLLNAVTNQDISIVSEHKGTTTDPVMKAMELLPVGPVVIIDTPGLDDDGDIGKLRIEKAKQVLNKTDVAVLVVDASVGMSSQDNEIIELFKDRELPYAVVYNKCDLIQSRNDNSVIYVSAKTKEGVYELKEHIAKIAKETENEKRIIGDKVERSDVFVLVTPIDSSAPKGRMILPQMQATRDILDSRGICLTVQTDELSDAIDALKNPPKMVITDSQAFGKVKDIVPRNIPLTSFSIVFARYKGILKTAVKGAAHIDKLKDGDYVLISEGCSHHRQCEDIGAVKLPNWVSEHTKKQLNFEFTSGGGFTDNIDKYSLVIHCGGCMLNEKTMLYRQRVAEEAGVAFTNYGTIIAYMNGILERTLEPFPEYLAMIK